MSCRRERVLERRLRAIPLLVRAQPLLRSRRELGLARPRRTGRRGSATNSIIESISSWICSSVTKTCASSCVMCLTRRSPCSVPPRSSRWSGRRFRVPDRKIAVGAELRSEEQHVAGAVHRLQRHRLLALVRAHEEHVFLVVLVVARGDVRLEVVEERRLHLEVATLSVFAAAQILERVPDHHAFRMPERRPGRVLGEMEEVELAARAGGDPARAPAPAARDGRPGRPVNRTRCRRSSSAGCSSRRRASTRRRGSSA